MNLTQPIKIGTGVKIYIFLIINLLGAFVAGPAMTFASMMSMSLGPYAASSDALNWTGYLAVGTCIAGIPIALICSIMGIVLHVRNKPDTALKVMKIPMLYAVAWFFLTSALAISFR